MIRTVTTTSRIACSRNSTTVNLSCANSTKLYYSTNQLSASNTTKTTIRCTWSCCTRILPDGWTANSGKAVGRSSLTSKTGSITSRIMRVTSITLSTLISITRWLVISKKRRMSTVSKMEGLLLGRIRRLLVCKIICCIVWWEMEVAIWSSGSGKARKLVNFMRKMTMWRSISCRS